MQMKVTLKTSEILEKALRETELTKNEILHLFSTNNTMDIYSIFSTAQIIRENNFGNTVFPCGFIYLSTYCSNSCTFCFYRKSNDKCPRYRKTPEEVLKYSKQLEKSGVHLIDLTLGEDPYYKVNFDQLVHLVKKIKNETGLPIMVSPGVISRHMLRELVKSGMDWYAVYQETHNKELFAKLRIGQSFDARITAKYQAKEEGALIEEGILMGIGETVRDRADSIIAMKDIGAQQVREMGFQPQLGTPMENWLSPPLLDEMKYIALMRITNQDKLIPASYDCDGTKGLQLRLMAGANVVTSLIPPESGLKGVAHAELNVDAGLRTVDTIEPYIKKVGLTYAPRKRYVEWIDDCKKKLP